LSDDTDEGTIIRLVLELHRTAGERKEGMVLAHAHILSGVKLGAALTHDDVARLHHFAAELFHAKTPAR